MTANDSESDDPIYEVEKIVNHRLTDENGIEYLIKWKGYQDIHNTWEKEKNIFSKGLLNEYWQSKSVPKKSTSNNNNNNNNNNKQEKDIRSAKVTATPPAGHVWSDIETIVNVFFTEPNIYFAEIKWKGDAKNTFIPTRIIKKHIPLKLIEFYETKLEYYIPNQQ